MGSYQNWKAYQKSLDLVIKIQKITQHFPPYEQYSLTDQIRRSSRSVCTNIAEAYYKSNYTKHFISKLLDASSENGETQVWLDMSLKFEYFDSKTHEELKELNSEIGKLLWFMIHYPNKFQQPNL
jgi:four helix bundle protein